jgi:hypothetical protein
MPFYRQYFLDISDHIRGMKEFNSSEDTAAVQVADENANGAAYELWDQDRLVVRRDIKQRGRNTQVKQMDAAAKCAMTYRIIFTEARFLGALPIPAESEKDAITKAKEQAAKRPFELWIGKRMIFRSKGEPLHLKKD